MNAVFVFNYKYVFIIFPAAGKKRKENGGCIFVDCRRLFDHWRKRTHLVVNLVIYYFCWLIPTLLFRVWVVAAHLQRELDTNLTPCRSTAAGCLINTDKYLMAWRRADRGRHSPHYQSPCVQRKIFNSWRRGDWPHCDT